MKNFEKNNQRQSGLNYSLVKLLRIEYQEFLEDLDALQYIFWLRFWKCYFVFKITFF